jgi:hypothetical protein
MAEDSKMKDSFLPKISIKSQENDSISTKIFTTHPKSRKRRINKRLSNFKYSIAKSQLLSIEKELGLEGLLEGKMVKQTIRMPFNLREAFKKENKANGTSTCKTSIELQMAWLLKSRMQKTAFGSTISKIIDANFTIESMNFTQNVQSRVRRNIRQNSGVDLSVDGLPQCTIGRDCGNAAVDVLIYQPKGKPPKEYPVCLMHETKLLGEGGTVWRLSK